MIGWLGAPMELTASQEEAEEWYGIKAGTFPGHSQHIITFEGGTRNHDNRVMMRGASKAVQVRHAWPYSNTTGGYVEVVLERYIRRKYENDLSRFANVYAIDTTEIIKKLDEKYNLHDRTWTAIIEHLNYKFFRLDRFNQPLL